MRNGLNRVRSKGRASDVPGPRDPSAAARRRQRLADVPLMGAFYSDPALFPSGTDVAL